MDIRRSGMKIVNETPSQRLSLLQHVEARHEQFRDLEDDDSLGLFLSELLVCKRCCPHQARCLGDESSCS